MVPAAADVTTETGAEQVAEALPRADVLVNNLGVFGSADPLEITDDEWRRHFDVNVLAAVRLTRLFLPGMTSAAGNASGTSPATRRSSRPPR